MTDTDQLSKLREALFESILPLIDTAEMDLYDKYDLYARLAQSRGEYGLYEKAYHAAQEIRSQSDQLRAYLDLLADIDGEIQVSSNRDDKQVLEQASESEAQNASETQ